MRSRGYTLLKTEEIEYDSEDDIKMEALANTPLEQSEVDEKEGGAK